jgi:adenosylmethionine-8-amino-7-oxononanoate aminotransferase
MADGRTVLCGTSGLWNVNFGYGRPEVRRAVSAALDDASYLTLFRYGHTSATRAAEALIDALAVLASIGCCSARPAPPPTTW